MRESWLRALAILFIVTMPFSAVTRFGLLGNFDTNLALVPAALLGTGLLFRGWLLRALVWRNPYAGYLRWIVSFFVFCAVAAIANGIILSAQGVSIYGLDPLGKSLVTAIVPLFIATIIGICFVVAALLPPRTLQRAMKIGFWGFMGYTAIQVVSLLVPNALYDGLRHFFEGGLKIVGGASYIAQFGRINGPTLEPAEFAKTLLLFFLPWLLLPAEGPARMLAVAAAAVATLTSLSLVGVATLAAVVLWMVLDPNVTRFRMMLLLAGLALLLAFPLYGDLAVTRLFGRLGESGDESALIRFTYNKAALALILEHPIIGLGWSNEIFFFPERVKEIVGLWEVQQNIATGDALTAKSLMLRLAMYSGLPALLAVVAVTFSTLRKRHGVVSRDLSRLRLAFLILLVAGTLDGGILTSLYLWAGPALCLGMAARRALDEGQSEVGATDTPEPATSRPAALPVRVE